MSTQPNVIAERIEGNLSLSGSVRGSSMSATTVSATTIYSGATNLSSIIISVANSGGDITRVQPGTNIVTGGTANAPTIRTSSNLTIGTMSFSGSVSGASGTLIKANALMLENNKTVGKATLSLGSATVNTSEIHSSDSLVFLTVQNFSGPPMAQAVYVSNIVNNTSFDILSPDPSDASTVAWMIVKY